MTVHDLEDAFYSHYAPLDSETILLLNQQCPGHLHNVIVGLEQHCFGAMCMEDSGPIIYRLYYATNQGGLHGDIIEVTSDQPNRDQLVFLFSQLLNKISKGWMR